MAAAAFPNGEDGSWPAGSLPQKEAALRTRLKKFVEVLLEPAAHPFYALKVASPS
jgi:hypothetical protein